MGSSTITCDRQAHYAKNRAERLAYQRKYDAMHKNEKRAYKLTQRYGPNRLRTPAKDCLYNTNKAIKKARAKGLAEDPNFKENTLPEDHLEKFIAWCQQL
jgi:hypothetical protein